MKAQALVDDLLAIPFDVSKVEDGVSQNEQQIEEVLRKHSLTVVPKKNKTDPHDFLVESCGRTIKIEAKSSKGGSPAWNGHKMEDDTIVVFSGPGGTTLFMGKDVVNGAELDEFNQEMERCLSEFRKRIGHLKTVKGSLVRRMGYPAANKPLTHPNRRMREASVVEFLGAAL